MGHKGKHKRSSRRRGSEKADVHNGVDAGVNQQVGGDQELACHPCCTFCDNCSEEELERYLLVNLQWVYNEAYVRLGELGYPESVVSNAILNNGHYYGEKDVLSNILDNSLKYLIAGKTNVINRPAFVSLQQLMDTALAGMVSGVQKTNPHLSRRDAMLCICRINNLGCPERLNLIPLVRRNVEESADEEFSANSEKLLTLCSDASSLNGDLSAELPSETIALVDQNEQLQDEVSSLLDIFHAFNLDESIQYVPLDEKDNMVIGLLQEVKDLSVQVMEMKEWAQKKVDQATTKVANDVIKLIQLRREMEQRLKKGKQTVADSSMMKLWAMKNNSTKATNQLWRMNELIRKLDLEYAEMNAELEASRLSASESMRNCADVAKREKKSLKRLVAWEKQKTELQNDTAAMEQQILELENKLVQTEATQKDAEVKQREARKARQLALEQLEEEMRQLKKTEPTNRRELEALHLKIETELQHHKDEPQRLELDLFRLMELRMFGELEHQQEDYTSDRNCLICEEKEVSVVLLPCAHQVLCSDCNDTYGKAGCPFCSTPIEQRIHVFGAQSF